MLIEPDEDWSYSEPPTKDFIKKAQNINMVSTKSIRSNY